MSVLPTPVHVINMAPMHTVRKKTLLCWFAVQTQVLSVIYDLYFDGWCLQSCIKNDGGDHYDYSNNYLMFLLNYFYLNAYLIYILTILNICDYYTKFQCSCTSQLIFLFLELFICFLRQITDVLQYTYTDVIFKHAHSKVCMQTTFFISY